LPAGKRGGSISGVVGACCGGVLGVMDRMAWAKWVTMGVMDGIE